MGISLHSCVSFSPTEQCQTRVVSDWDQNTMAFEIILFPISSTRGYMPMSTHTFLSSPSFPPSEGLQCVAVCCSVSQRRFQCITTRHRPHPRCCSVLQCVAVCCIVSQRVLQRIVTHRCPHRPHPRCCSVLRLLQYVLQCVTTQHRLHPHRPHPNYHANPTPLVPASTSTPPPPPSHPARSLP